MDALDALIRQVSGLQSDVGILAQRQERTESLLATQEAARMESRLSPGSVSAPGLRIGGLDIPAEVASGSSLVERLRAGAGAYSGRIDPYLGRANRLYDPAMEGVVSTTLLGPAFAPCGEEWQAKRTFTGAGTPAAYIERGSVRSLGRGSSAVVSSRHRWNAATGSPVASEVQFEPYQDLTASTDTPWFAAAVRIRWQPETLVTAGVTGTARLAIVDSGGTEVASSDPVVLEDGTGALEVPLACAVAAPSGGHKPRVIIAIASPSIASSREVSIKFLELQLTESETEDPPAYTPAIGAWVPTMLSVSALDPDYEPVIVVVDEDSDPVWQVFGDGSQSWGPTMFPVLPQWFASTFDTAARNSTTPAAIPGCKFPVRADRTYVFHVTLAYVVTGTNQCVAVGFRHAGGAAVATIVTETNATSGASTRDRANGSSAATDYMGTAVTSVSDTGRKLVTIDGHYQATDDGDFQFMYARNGTSNSPGVTVIEGAGGWALANPE